MSQHKRKILQGSAANLTKVLFTVPFALILPPLFVHSMAPTEYSAWMLILQGSAYINLLDLGLQTAVSKFVAQYDAVGDRVASSRILSSAFAILCLSSFIGAAVIAVITWRVPQLFNQMPPYLIAGMRGGILLVGLSTAFLLPFNAFLSAFVGLQKYGFPTVLAISSKSLLSAALIGFLLVRADLVQLACLMAIFNVGTAVIQFFGWKNYVKERVGFSFGFINRESALQLAKYGSTLSVWMVAMLLISGLDVVIVGHYDYGNTAYYGTATAVANFMLLIIVSLFGPLIPAVSSLQFRSSSSQIGTMVVTATRLCVLLLCLIGLPIFMGAYPLLKLWVGHDYAIRSASFLQVLVLGNVIRQLCYPYALVVMATGKQHLATIAGIAEAVVNVTVSIYLVRRIGAIGVAIGTVVGALVSIGVHIAISMKLTHSIVSLSRRHFVLEGLLRPLTCVIPTLILLPFWTRSSLIPISPIWIGPWMLATLGIAWFIGLVSAERKEFKRRLFQLARWRPARR
jgi:O-antigen/teichoic acid export membrane protein